MMFVGAESEACSGWGTAGSSEPDVLGGLSVDWEPGSPDPEPVAVGSRGLREAKQSGLGEEAGFPRVC